MSHIVLTIDNAVVYDNQAAGAAPSTDQRIRDVIAQMRSQNTAWPDVAVFLQTWVLQRALSPEEWEVAYAAGMPRPDPVKPADPDNATQTRVNPSVVRFPEDAGQNFVLEGTTGVQVPVPAGFKGLVRLVTIATNDASLPQSQAYVSKINDTFPQSVGNPTATNPYNLRYGEPANVAIGEIYMEGTVRLSVEQPAGSAVMFQFYVGS